MEWYYQGNYWLILTVILSVIILIIIGYCNVTNTHSEESAIILLILLLLMLISAFIFICIYIHNLNESSEITTQISSTPITKDYHQLVITRNGITHTYRTSPVHEGILVHHIIDNKDRTNVQVREIPILSEVQGIYRDPHLDCVMIKYTNGSYSMVDWDDQPIPIK